MTDAPTRSKARELARADLHGLLERLADNGLTIPCTTGTTRQSAPWTSDDPDDQALAARCCLPCPALADCGDYGRSWPREHGVYGGLTEAERRPKVGRPPVIKKTCEVCGRDVAQLARHHRLVHEGTAA